MTRPRLLFCIEEIERDLVAGDIAAVIADLARDPFDVRVLSVRGNPREAAGVLPPDVAFTGPLERGLLRTSRDRRALAAVREAAPHAILFVGRRSVLDLAGRLLERGTVPAAYVAPDADPTFPWGHQSDLARFTKVVARTQQMTVRLVDELGLPEGSVSTIYNAAPLSGAARVSRSRPADGSEDASIARPRRAIVGVVGDPPAMAVSLLRGAAPAINFRLLPRPTRDEAAVLSAGSDPLSACALLLFLPESDWLSGFEALLAGMAKGKPVVAAVAPSSLDHLVMDGESGRYVASADPAQIAATLTELLAAPELLESMGSAARLHVAGKYHPDRRRGDFDALCRVLCGVPFPASPDRGQQGSGLSVRFRPPGA